MEMVERPYTTDNMLGERLIISTTSGDKINIVVMINKMLIFQSMVALLLGAIVAILMFCYEGGYNWLF
ncbi:hypothetical protein SU60_15750 [Vibrio mytili]|uniref:Uncharacterized protein n=1 Tax=Vibrio mytili TaxID=50718 RepID=A0A0C3DFJ2_9VIBR|nr:hypothetical protein SU60_15750 [Vibrio mytili]